MMAMVLSFTVLGAAKPQGSTKTITRRDAHGNMRAVITHSNRESLLLWRQAIRAAVQLHAPQLRNALIRDAVAIIAIFHRSRPASISKKRIWPKTAPDLDKLLRAVGDALESTVLVNDCLIKGWIAWERYTDGASRLELQVWEPDLALLPATDVNPFMQPGFF